MSVQDTIKKRRAYRSLAKIQITDAMKQKLIEAAQLAPSCFNNQPWRYVFIDDAEELQKLQSVYAKGNEWAHEASMVIAVCSKKELDCMIKERLYYAFDTGLGTGQMLLQAVELGLVAHPIAGFSPKKVRQLLAIPEDMEVITLIVFGGYRENSDEATRPVRKKPEEIAFFNRFQQEQS